MKGNRVEIVSNLLGTVPENPDVSTCANPSCSNPFTRLCEGHLYAFPVSDSEEWGLPSHIKQKAVWLCQQCAETLYVRLDRKHHRVQVAHKPQNRRVA